MNTLAEWFGKHDDKPPRRKDAPPITIRHQIRQRTGPWLLTVASSCGYRPPRRALKPDLGGVTNPEEIHRMTEGHVDGGGFVSATVWWGNEEEPRHKRIWQATSWREAQYELGELMSLLRRQATERVVEATPPKPVLLVEASNVKTDAWDVLASLFVL